MITDIKKYGINEYTLVHNETEQYVEEIKILGYTIVKNLLAESTLTTVRSKLDQLYIQQTNDIGGEKNLALINDENIIRCPLSQDSLFLELAVHPRILSIMSNFFGNYFILQQQNGILLPPYSASYQTGWHRDLPYQHFISSRPLAISALFCIDPFNQETGGTYVLPASHKIERFPSEEYILAHEKGIIANAGDVLIFDSMVYHRAGHNSAKFSRRGLNHVYSLPFLKQQISLPKALNGKFSDDPFLKKFLGYEGEPAHSALEWRRNRLS